MGDVDYTLVGAAEVSKNLQLLAATIPIAAAAALNAVAEETMTDAKNRTPVEFGTLKRSGKVEQHAKPNDLSAVLSFGTEYAVYVHERTNLRHRVGEAKFLERAVAFTSRWFEQRIANELKGWMNTGAGSPGGTGNL